MALADGLNDSAHMAPDTEIVKRVLAGDLSSFELVMRRYNRRRYRSARGVQAA